MDQFSHRSASRHNPRKTAKPVEVYVRRSKDVPPFRCPKCQRAVLIWDHILECNAQKVNRR